MGLGDADADGGGTPALPTIMMMLLVAVVAVGKLCPDVFVFALHVCRRSLRRSVSSSAGSPSYKSQDLSLAAGQDHSRMARTEQCS